MNRKVICKAGSGPRVSLPALFAAMPGSRRQDSHFRGKEAAPPPEMLNPMHLSHSWEGEEKGGVAHLIWLIPKLPVLQLTIN